MNCEFRSEFLSMDDHCFCQSNANGAPVTCWKKGEQEQAECIYRKLNEVME